MINSWAGKRDGRHAGFAMNGYTKLMRVILPVACLLAVAGCERQAAPDPGDPAVPAATVTLVSNARIYTFDPGDRWLSIRPKKSASAR